jgi:hypothetical protein
MKKNQYLYEGTEVVTDDLRIGFVDKMYSPDRVIVRFHSPPWPFPEMAIKQRCQLKEVPIEYEDAMF